MAPRITGLYAIADTRYLSADKLISATADAIRGGARIIQYRDKSTDAARRAQQAASLGALCATLQALFIVNDDVALARAVGADGVHLGRDDGDVASARRKLGASAIIGVSCYNELARAQVAHMAGADYIAFGSFFPSRTKPQAVRAELELLDAARAAIPLPIVAIGGIDPVNGMELLRRGADALAVIEGIFGKEDTAEAARTYARLFDEPGVTKQASS
jgi:thiamine-phosphate pyrophosphorylase